uniref:hypothetical protein n=1 Tax=Rheinheimera pleomorphica TaxID=2703963 RepID=UPI00396B3A16
MAVGNPFYLILQFMQLTSRFFHCLLTMLQLSAKAGHLSAVVLFQLAVLLLNALFFLKQLL